MMASPRFELILRMILRVLGESSGGKTLQVADIGSANGDNCRAWAERGHSAHGLDIEESLVRTARTKAAEQGLDIEFQVGSAVALPWLDRSMDVCLAVEVLEHVADWRTCLDECARVLRSGGVLYLTTTNKLCPIQEEFRLPLYSWYPTPLKRHFVRLSLTTKPELANYTSYPAVNWFTFYQLRDALRERGLDAMDRFDVTSLQEKGLLGRGIVKTIRSVPALRWLAHVASRGTIVVALKR